MFKFYNNNIYDYTKYIIRNEGIRNLYKGYNSCILTYPLYVGLQFSVYNQCKEYNLNLFLCGAISGLISQTLVFPGDVIKRQMQLNGINDNPIIYNNLFDCIRKIYLKEGIRGFYTGLSVNIIKCIPGTSIQFVIYDYCKGLFNK